MKSMEIVKSKRLSVIVLLISLIFLGMVSCAFGQVERMITTDSKGKKTVTRYSSYVWSIQSPLNPKEYVDLNIKSDSIDAKSITLDLFAYFPKNINPKGADMTIVYMDGTKDFFKQSVFVAKDNYVEYEPTIGINNLEIKPIKSISIGKIITTEDSVEGEVYFTYFMSFL